MKRLDNRIDYVKELLKKGFDFTKNESYEFKRDSAAGLRTKMNGMSYGGRELKATL